MDNVAFNDVLKMNQKVFIVDYGAIDLRISSENDGRRDDALLRMGRRSS